MSEEIFLGPPKEKKEEKSLLTAQCNLYPHDLFPVEESVIHQNNPFEEKADPSSPHFRPKIFTPRFALRKRARKPKAEDTRRKQARKRADASRRINRGLLAGNKGRAFSK